MRSQKGGGEKELVVSMGSLAASGGYYVSSPASRIVANPERLRGLSASSWRYERRGSHEQGRNQDRGDQERPAQGHGVGIQGIGKKNG